MGSNADGAGFAWWWGFGARERKAMESPRLRVRSSVGSEVSHPRRQERVTDGVPDARRRATAARTARV